MAQMTVKNLIETVFIDEVGELVISHPYISFMVMGNGIEFLGKCISLNELNKESSSRNCFEDAIKNLNAFTRYRGLIGSNNNFNLYTSLRCGLTHVVIPKFPITLSSKNEMPHLHLHANETRINLRCEDFYKDFKNACEELLRMPGNIANKLAQPYLSVPDIQEIKYPMSLSIVDNCVPSYDASGSNFSPPSE